MLLFASAVPSSFGLDDHNPIGVTGAFEGLITTACGYNVLNHNATRQIEDIVVPGAVGKYGLKLTRYYNSRREFGSLGPGWTHNYEWSTSTLDDKIYYPNGNVLDSSCNPPLGASDGWEDHPSNGNGTFRLADGGTIVFQNHVATSIIDPYGQTITITYAGFQIDRVTEPGGRYLQFTYRSLETQVDAYDGSGHRIDWVIYHYSPIRPARRGTQGIPVNCVTSVDYSDDTRAFYSYRDDNVPDHPGPHCPCSVKSSPLVETCQDVRYNGPMRHICYDYQDNGPHGAILAEKYSLNGSTNGARVSWIDPPAPSPIVTEPWFDTSYTEYRGDGPSRRFIYTPLHFSRVFNDDRDGCPKWNSQTGGPAPQQFLKTYTDFQGRTTWLHYDTNWYVDRVTDARGRFDGDPEHSTLYDHGPDIGEIRTITHPAPGPGGTPSSIHYDYEDPTPQTGDPHYVTRLTDERGNVTKHVRDVKHRISRTEYRDPGANDSGALLAYETVSYCDQIDSQCSNNPLQQIKTQKLKNGAYVHYQYDPRGLLLAKTEPTWVADGPTALSTGPKTTYTYYPDGDGNKVPWSDRVKTVTLAANVSGFRASETYEYDRTFVEGVTNLNGAPVAGRGLVTKITHADGKYQQSKYDVYGNKVWEDNELRKVTTYAYDEYNRLLNVTRPLNGITNYTYNPSNGGSPYTHTTNNPDTITVRTSSTNDIVTKNVYDENFRRTSSKAAYQTPKEATTWFGYDEVGNQTYVTDPRGSGSGDARYTTYTDYDERNRKWRTREPLERTTWFEYGDNMNVTKIHRPDGTVEEKVYDGLNRLITDTVPKEPGVNIVTQLQYNPWDGDPTDSGHSGGLLQKVIDGEAHNCQFRYDAAGQKTQMIYHDGSSQQWAYDDAHNLKNRTTVHGEVQDFEYDNRNRKITEWWDGWPADGEWRAFRYDDANRLWLAANGIGAYWSGFIADVRRAYDDAGRLTLDQQTVYDARGIGTTRSINYPNYDDSGKLLRMYVNGVSPAYDYTFGYDEMGRFNKIFLTGSNNPQFEYSYDPASNETQRCNRVNNIAQNDIPDELNRMSSVEVKNTFTNTQLGLETYEYYPIGRLHTVTREDNKQDSFIYYLDGELNVASYGAAATPPPTPTPRPSATPTPTGGQVAEPIFAPAGGNIYPNSSIRVQISTSTTGAQIRYKLDENTWTTIANGGYTIYFEPGVMGKTLTAVASKLGMAESNPHSDSYWYENGRAGSGTYPLDMAGTQPAPGPMAPNVSTVTYTLDKAGNRRSVNGMSYLPNEVNQ